MLPQGPSSSEPAATPAGPLPKPAGIISLGSADDLERKAQEIKENRKLRAAKTVSLNQSKNKVRQADDKIKEIVELKEKLGGVTEAIM